MKKLHFGAWQSVNQEVWIRCLVNGEEKCKGEKGGDGKL